MHLLLIVGMGEAIFRKVFPYFFPLADSYVRAIRYIRYNLELKMDLMIRNVVILEFMDRVKQIRIPHPLPKKDHPFGWSFFGRG